MAGGDRMIFLLGCLIAVAAVLQCAEAQTTHIVGGNLGWVIPSSASVYPDWASTKTFRVGDTLQFNFVSGAHTVAEVNKASYDACNGEAPVGTVLDSSPATVALNSAGNKYYICTVGQHCVGGQKLAVTVLAGAVARPSPSPIATPPTTTATPPTTTATPPTATPPTTSATPPTGTPPSTTATPPPTSPMTPPQSGDGPSVQPPSGSTPPPPSAAPSLAVAGFSSVTLLSVAVAFLL